MSEMKPSASATEISGKAAAWIRQRDFWEWGESDQERLEAWLSESPAHEAAFLRLEAAWNRTERLAALRGAKRGWMQNSLPLRQRIFRVSASFALIAVGLIAFFFFLPEKSRVYATGLGDHQTIKLADGSRIELNTDTTLRLGDDERSASLLKGEAYFQIVHNAAHPFVLTIADKRLVDLGTKFLVRKDNDHLEISLMEGRARVESVNHGDQSHSAILMPGDVATGDRQLMTIKEKPVRLLANELGWERGVLIFRHTTLAEAVAEFNRYNRKKIVIADESVAQRTIGGTFTISQVERFGLVVRDVLGLRVENRADEVVISR